VSFSQRRIVVTSEAYHQNDGSGDDTNQSKNCHTITSEVVGVGHNVLKCSHILTAGKLVVKQLSISNPYQSNKQSLCYKLLQPLDKRQPPRLSWREAREGSIE
jgi:hypothetical protein